MTRKIRSAALVVALGAVAAMFLLATSASAFTIFPKFENWRVTGSLTDKKLNQQIVLPEGTFNGESEIELPSLNGILVGTTAIPTFETTIKIFGLPAKATLTFEQVGLAEGSTAARPNGCGGAPGCIELSVPTKVNLVMTKLVLLGITFNERCETKEPGLLALNDELTVGEFVSVGSHFVGTTNIAPMKCNGIFGFINGPNLTALMSGPENPYVINVAPPA
jgi:hypothetical protein